ncbi:MAG TPA: MAPEG family protein [Rhizomicrobium sp.]|nr:MAPEG family protein [Rhizomicrobium sp.]
MTSILTPVLALIVLSLVVWIWMYATRIPAMQRAGIAPQSARFPGSLDVLPENVRQVANNYNHLMEQPTIFYALVFYIYLSGGQDHLYIVLAWAYVGLRVIHTLIQCTVNVVPLRFTVFALSTLVLMAMAVRAVLALS